ncbi:heme-degrading domain-containing protein [Micromonospora sp. NBC_00898]|uniref:heme-degrading domain-containing protein n=1 Tax=Micromonospora sp. NBC_00898 TaxID=2975981 RepID=UPI00386315A8|nr:heme-degrading domain-containing protein [Micromonospora sp. NBC_00898]
MPPDHDPWPTLEELLREEGELELPALSESDAYELGMRAVAAAREQQLPIAVGVWRAGRQLFHCGLPGSTLDNDAWLRRKGRVVMRFEHSSLYMARLCQDRQVTLAEKFGLPASRYAAAGGAVPLRVRGTGVVGWFGVSGLPQLEDHRFVVDTLRAISR